MLLSQAMTVPFALLFNFKVAYIWTYICGYMYGRNHQLNNRDEKEKKRTDRFYYVIAIVGLIVRLVLDEFEFSGILDAVSSLAVQWIKLFQGGAIFIWVINHITPDKWDSVSESTKRVIHRLSQYSFEVYIVHEFFTCEIFTQFIPFEGVLRVLVAWGAIAIATVMLVCIEKLVAKARRKTVE